MLINETHSNNSQPHKSCNWPNTVVEKNLSITCYVMSVTQITLTLSALIVDSTITSTSFGPGPSRCDPMWWMLGLQIVMTAPKSLYVYNSMTSFVLDTGAQMVTSKLMVSPTNTLVTLDQVPILRMSNSIVPTGGYIKAYIKNNFTLRKRTICSIIVNSEKCVLFQ